jgi:DNA replication and repair protein RecF
MYLAPSLRREFLDTILTNSYPEYEKLHREYKKILTHRNKLLKNIRDNKSSRDEISFWNEQFIHKACEVYRYRLIIIKFLETHIKSAKEYFKGKIDDITFVYHSKIENNDIEGSIKKYLDTNLERDIIL